MMLGMADSGKTTLTYSYTKRLKDNDFNVTTVNLDSGVERLPYTPGFDIRNIFTIKDVMIKYNLVPNGALIKSMKLIEENLNQISSMKPFINDEDCDLILIDTPNQMEVFVFRPISPRISLRLKSKGSTIGVYIVDGGLVKKYTCRCYGIVYGFTFKA